MGYNILELRPELKPDLGKPELGTKCPDKLQPLTAANIPLGPELGNPGEANQDELAKLIVTIRDATEETSKEWTAADLNNLACAHFWFNGAREKAISYFEKALALQSPIPTSVEEQTIRCNLELVKAPSQAG